MLEALTSSFSQLVKNLSGKSSISEANIRDTMEQVKTALVESDVNLRVVRRFVNRTMEEAMGEKVLKSLQPGQQFIKIIHDAMVRLLGSEKQDLQLKGQDQLSVVLMMGLQGAGKTTSSAKLALRLKKQGRKVLLLAADLQRPAAVEQLRILGKQAGVEVHTLDSQDPVQVVKDGLARAKRENFDTLVIDTAGRLQIDQNLMDQLQAVVKLTNPDEKILVADSMTGQSAVEVAQSFEEQVGVTGFLLTKFDSDARGGAALSLASITSKPVKLVGVGEKLEDLEVFHPDRTASRILGMGDVVSLVEKAQESISQEDAQKLQQKMIKATFSLEDYLEQFQRVRKMGSMKSLMAMIPGMNADMADQIDEKAVKREEAIILSMTLMERQNHRIIGPTRKTRIARGSGTSVFAVNQLLKKFEKTRDMMKKMAKNAGKSPMSPAAFGR